MPWAYSAPGRVPRSMMTPTTRAPRIAQGADVLNDHAINGFDGDAATPMLAKGGRPDLSDQEVIDAVTYMVEQSQ